MQARVCGGLPAVPGVPDRAGQLPAHPARHVQPGHERPRQPPARARRRRAADAAPGVYCCRVGGMYCCHVGCTAVVWHVLLSCGVYCCRVAFTAVLWGVLMSCGIYCCHVGRTALMCCVLLVRDIAELSALRQAGGQVGA